MTTKEQRREKRLRLIVEAIQRWGVKLEKADRTVKRSVRMIAKLERARQRAEKQMKAAETQVESSISAAIGLAIERDISPKKFAAISSPTDDDIPGFLQRSKANADRDKADAEAVRAEVDADKKRKAELSAEKRKIKQEVRDADLTGMRRKMPLTGRAALDALK